MVIRLGSKQLNEEEAVLQEALKVLNVAARRLVTNVIEQCAGKLESGIKQFLISSMSEDNKFENHHIDCHQVIYHAYHCAPQILSGVVPYLTGELLGVYWLKWQEIQNLTDIIQMYHQTKARHLSMQQSDANSLTAHLEYILSYSIHALAHHSCPKIDDFRQLNLILPMLLHRDEGVKPEFSSNGNDLHQGLPAPLVSYAAAIGGAAAAEAMAAGLAEPDDDEGVIIDDDDDDDLEGDADDEMEEGDDNNGDDDGNGGEGGVVVRIVGYGLYDFVTRIDVQQVPNAATLDERVQDELVRHQLPNTVQPPDQYNIIYVVQQGLHDEVNMTVEELQDGVGWFLVPVLLRRIVAQPILNPRLVNVVLYRAQEPLVPEVINHFDITECEEADGLLINLEDVLAQEFNILEVEHRSTFIIDLPLYPNDERNLAEVGEIQPWIIAVQRIMEIRVTIVNNGPPSPHTGDSVIED